MTEIDTVTLPAAYAPAFVNDDYSGLDGRDLLRARAIVRLLARHGWSIVSTADEEPGFTWHYRLHGGLCQGGDVLDYVVHKVRS